MARCSICKKSAVTGNQISHSQVHTKRKFKANLQKVNGLILCTKCLKTIKTIDREIEALEANHDHAEETKETVTETPTIASEKV